MRGIAQRRKKREGQRQRSTGGCKRSRVAPRRRTKPGGRHQLRIEEGAAPTSTVLPLEVSADCPWPDDEESEIQGIALPPLELRLQKRYLVMVQSHMRSAPELAAGVASLPSSSTAFPAVQGTWRFLNNDRVTLPALVEPLREAARTMVEELDSRFVLLVHDWSKVSFNHPNGKRDLTQLTHATDVGYELTTALLVSADNGSPLAPMEMHLKTADGVLSTRDPAPEDVAHLDQVLVTMQASRGWKLAKPLLHVIDREADSVDHYRQWDGYGFKFLVRADDRRVNWSGKSLLLSEIRRSLRRRKEFFKVTDDASYNGQAAELWVAETRVILDRPAKKNVGGKRFQRAGRPLALRFIVVQLRDGRRSVLAEWKLLTNAPKRTTAEHLARCYYWRWRIESYFKLLKSHGQQLEKWQQETGPAIARRLLVASMACVLVWHLQTDNSKEAEELNSLSAHLEFNFREFRREFF
jgi:hypothetical protein